MKLSRKALDQASKELPISAILGRQVSDNLTPKMRKFAKSVAMGATKADAYRSAYNVTSAKTMQAEPYKLAADPRIQREIDAYTLAIEVEKHRSPAALRSLVIQSLTQILIDPDTKPAVRINAAKVLGTVTEVAAFTERKEVRTISSSEDARARVMQELRALVSGGAEDATVIEADSLLRELTGDAAVNINAEPTDNINGEPPSLPPMRPMGKFVTKPAIEENAEPAAQTPPAPDPPDA